MGKARIASGMLASCLLLWGAAPALAQPTVAQMLSFKPRQPGVQISTPTPDEQAGCKVELERGAQPGSSGWVLLDSQKRKVRRFFDSNADKKIDLWSYYKDGSEVYREIDTNLNERADQYRWLNAGGMKWGVDADEDGKLDSWKWIATDEVAQEVFHAVATRDFARLRMLLITETEVRALKLPAARTDKLLKQLAAAEGRFNETIKKLPNLTDKAIFIRLESGAPHCIPKEASGAEQDYLKQPSRVVLFETPDKKHEWLHTGAMIKVGSAWRLIEGPGLDTGPTEMAPQNADPVLAQLMEKLSTLDKTPPPPAQTPGHRPELVKYYQARVALIEQIADKTKDGTQKEVWIKQLADNLSTWAQSSDKKDQAALQKVSQLREQHARAAAGSSLTGYIAYRELWAKFGRALVEDIDELPRVQRAWMEELAKFVQQYPKADDAPDALHHLAMGSEFGGKEDEAKRYYEQIATNFPNHALAAKARGSVRRLDLTGKALELSGPTLTGQTFDLTRLRGKVVVVYYWASYCRDCQPDVATLRKLQSTYSAKGLEIVTVNLDETAQAATGFLQTNPLTATHLFQAADNASGLSSPLATQYGIMGLPTVFLVGKDGNVISRTLQVNSLEDAVKKAL